jgi:hypothetical protein
MPFAPARCLTLLLLSSIAGCGHPASGLPGWLTLRTGNTARLAYSSDYDPEHAWLYASATSARASIRASAIPAGAREALSGSVVLIKRVDPLAVEGKHIVFVTSDRFRGWVVAEDELLPVPPAGVHLIVPKRIDHVDQELYSAQEDDDDADGVPLGGTSHVTYEGFEASPGNPEYIVRVDDGPLAGSSGYVPAQELETLRGRAFRLVKP